MFQFRKMLSNDIQQKLSKYIQITKKRYVPVSARADEGSLKITASSKSNNIMEPKTSGLITCRYYTGR